MIDKRVASLAEAVADIKDGAVLLVSGFGPSGCPDNLLKAVLDQGARDLVLVTNNAGNDNGETGIAALLANGRVRKVVCSFPRSANSNTFQELYAQGKVELELVPQGTLSERIRAAGAGIGGFYTPTSAGTDLAQGKEVREIDGRAMVLEKPLPGDFALVRASLGDRWGNLVYHSAGRNFGPTRAMAGGITIAEVRETVALGTLEPERIVTPGIFVDRVVEVRA
jgi:3-oxoadipate CoA-transferase, alpha subunit